MILLINICKERLHYFEFVKPIEDILKKNRANYFVRHYKDIKNCDLENAEKVIICGASLKDFDFYNNWKSFDWIKSFEKPLLGICGGAQILSKMFGGELKNSFAVGLDKINFEEKCFFGLKGKVEIYQLHQLGFKKVGRNFEKLAISNFGIQVIKHKKKPFYGVLFHPEVRNKSMITEFVKNG